MDEITIEILNSYSYLFAHNIENINEMLKQLSPNAPTISAYDIRRMIEQEDFFVFVAVKKRGKPRGYSDKIVGLGIIFFRETLMRSAGFIEDVIVEEHYRKHGVGRSICQKMIGLARARDTHAIYLTSGKQRKGGHGLWRSLGFEEKNSTRFILSLR